MTNKKPDYENINQLIENINKAWLSHDLDSLNGYFHEGIVFVKPGFSGELKGREACIKSFEEFLEDSVVNLFEITGKTIDIWGTTAIAHYTYDVNYTIGDQAYDEKGRDLFVFKKEKNKWMAVWRTMFIPISK